MTKLEVKILARQHIIATINEELANSYEIDTTGTHFAAHPNVIKQEYLWRRKELNQKKLQELMKRSKKLECRY